jgi:hypothetical protein
MASNTKNVKLGVCSVTFGGVDLGYTKGGVEVSVKTDTHKVNVDQFGKTPINELVMGREVSAKAPLAETTLENLILTMPGSVLVQTGGANATGSITITTNPVADDTIIVNGVTVTFKTAVIDPATQVLIGAAAGSSAANLQAFLEASTIPQLAFASYAVAASVVSIKYGSPEIYGTLGKKGIDGNNYTLLTGTAAAKVTMSGATLAGGTAPTSERVDVMTGIGSDLLASARELRLHPASRAAGDQTEDFVIPLAGTPGNLTFAYKLEDERVYNVEFQGYPDSTTGRVFYIGK